MLVSDFNWTGFNLVRVKDKGMTSISQKLFRKSKRGTPEFTNELDKSL